MPRKRGERDEVATDLLGQRGELRVPRAPGAARQHGGEQDARQRRGMGLEHIVVVDRRDCTRIAPKRTDVPCLGGAGDAAVQSIRVQVGD